MADARRHHYISQFYLRNFLGSGTPPLLYVIDKRLSSDFQTSTRNVAHEKDFHRVDVAGIAPNTIETALSGFERQAATALRAVVDRRSVGQDEFGNTLLYYMALLLVKNPAARSTIDEFVDRIMTTIARRDASDPVRFKNKMDDMMAEGRMEPDTDVEGLRQSILAKEHNVSLAREAHLNLEFATARDIMQFFVARKWLFVEAAPETSFVTCDRPVVLTRDNPGLLGLADPAVKILFAVSPQVAILGGADFIAGVIAADRTAVAEFNAQIAWNADRQIYARDGGFEFVASDGTIKPGPQIVADPAFVAQSG